MLEAGVKSLSLFRSKTTEPSVIEITQIPQRPEVDSLSSMRLLIRMARSPVGKAAGFFSELANCPALSLPNPVIRGLSSIRLTTARSPAMKLLIISVLVEFVIFELRMQANGQVYSSTKPEATNWRRALPCARKQVSIWSPHKLHQR